MGYRRCIALTLEVHKLTLFRTLITASDDDHRLPYNLCVCICICVCLCVCVSVHLHVSVVFTNTVIYTYLWGSVYFMAAYGRKFYYGPSLIGLLSMDFCPFICQVKIEQLMIWFFIPQDKSKSLN